MRAHRAGEYDALSTQPERLFQSAEIQKYRLALLRDPHRAAPRTIRRRAPAEFLQGEAFAKFLDEPQDAILSRAPARPAFNPQHLDRADEIAEGDGAARGAFP
jgi:hypothetical protein